MQYITEQEGLRLKTKYTVLADGCWKWTDHIDKDGYGICYFRRKNRRAHRVFWYSVNGVIGNDFFIDHVCKRRNCVNPEHLRKVTPRQNALENSNGIGAINAAKTHCLNGHPFDKKWGKQRYCSICHAIKIRKLHQKWKEHPLLEGV